MRPRARTLWLHCVRHDVLDGDGPGSSTLLSGVLFLLLASTLAAALCRGEPLRAAVALELAFLFVFALVDAFGDVASAFLDPRDLPLIRSQPVRPLDYARARLAALALPMGVKSLALGIPPVAARLADGAGARAIAGFLASLAAMQVACAALAILLLLMVRRIAPRLRIREVLAWLRALVLVGATGGWLLFLRGGAGDGGDGTGPGAFALPSAWFAELQLALAGHGGSTAGVAAAIGSVLAAAAGIAVLAANYVGLLEGLERAPGPRHLRRRPRLRDWFERAFVARDERPAFRLGIALLRREKTFRMQTLPLLGYPLLFLALGRGRDDDGLFALMFVQLPAVVLSITVLFLRHTDSPAGGWLLSMHGARLAAPLEAGARKALWWTVALPLSIVAAALLVADRGPTFGVAAGAAGLLAASIATVGLSSRQAWLPFVRRFRGRVEAGEEGASWFGLLFGLIVLAAVEWRVLREGATIRILAAAAALAACALLLRRRRAVASLPLAVDRSEAPERRGAPLPAFPIRLRRELAGLAVFFGLSGAALTAFFAWA